MGFTKISSGELNSRGATTLANQPEISAQELKQEFDAPAKEVVAPKFNNLIDELESTSAAASLGGVAPTGFTGVTVQAILNALATSIKTIEAVSVGATPSPGQTGDNVQALLDDLSSQIGTIISQITTLQGASHTHSNKSLLDSYNQTNTDLADAVSMKHSHSNKSTLDKLSEDGSGNPTFNGNTIPTSGQTGGFQKYIDEDNLLPPSGSTGTEGDLKFYSSLGDPAKALYRYEDNDWVNVALTHIEEGNNVYPFRKFTITTQDPGEGAAIDEDEIIIVIE
jgi:hypothetical protein